ncbi:MAG TPA: (d)CMP kinase [Verrucomicrobiales bacterium]|nr:(d)CMP kinase [Verrucomicrobiales bacterium]
MKSPIVITIDGPSASGKGTVSRVLAQRLGYVYVDTGAMYRTLAWHCLNKGVDVQDEKKVASACRHWKARLECAEGQVFLSVAGYRPEKEIRESAASGAVPFVARVPAVRKWMKKTQQDCVQFGNLVMEGRDIGTNIFPDTDFKFFLDASPEVRAKRRHAQGVAEDVHQRDKIDSQRAAAPLMRPLGSLVIDNSHQTPEETVAAILQKIDEIRAARRPS